MTSTLSDKEMLSMYVASVEHIKKQQEDETLYDPNPVPEKEEEESE